MFKTACCEPRHWCFNQWRRNIPSGVHNAAVCGTGRVNMDTSTNQISCWVTCIFTLLSTTSGYEIFKNIQHFFSLFEIWPSPPPPDGSISSQDYCCSPSSRWKKLGTFHSPHRASQGVYRARLECSSDRGRLFPSFRKRAFECCPGTPSLINTPDALVLRWLTDVIIVAGTHFESHRGTPSKHAK